MSGHITLNHIYYSTPTGKAIFQGLNLSIQKEKIGLIGKNGIGKSTLAKLIAGLLLPKQGKISQQGRVHYCEQRRYHNDNETIAEFLNAKEKIQALQRITNNEASESDFELVDTCWDILETIDELLAKFQLSPYELSTPLSILSGGEFRKLALAKTFYTNSDFIILDEPTNDLDQNSKQALLKIINSWDKGLVVISHDRELLDSMERIIELSETGVENFGGNFSYYQEQKEILLQA